VTVGLDYDGAGQLSVSFNGVVVGVATQPGAPLIGDRVGFGYEWRQFAAPPDQPRIESVCVGGTDGGAPHKTSWVAGWRTGASSGTVAWSDVNTGPTDLQSAQAALVVDADTSGDTPDVTGGDLVIGGVDDPFTGDIFEAE